MDLLEIVFAGIVGALGAILAYITVGKPQENKVKFTIVLVVCFLGLRYISNEYVLPPIREWFLVREAENALAEMPIYQILKEHDPTTYNEIERRLKENVRLGGDGSTVIPYIRQVLAEKVQEHAPYCTDEAMVNYIRITVKNIQKLMKIDPLLAFQYVYPNQFNNPSFRGHLTHEDLLEEANAKGRVLETAITNPQLLPDSTICLPIIEDVSLGLYNDYGDDIVMLTDPLNPDNDRELYCEMLVEMYQRILAFPPSQNGLVLRYAFTL